MMGHSALRTFSFSFVHPSAASTYAASFELRTHADEQNNHQPPLHTTTLSTNTLMMSSRLVMKHLQSNYPAQRTSQRPSTLPELPTFSSIGEGTPPTPHLQSTVFF
ncbi:hypothetical protein T265_06207 [Opisthorchis viverrini]|uniref:Uncharacterized protein n=1 Tax=Opisthorchis viverrini TaxID=6198 RepID=A0A074ZH77_OPIVI|nr:hypothetical protein T265_06207 [Opisthorchis viverrini]KER26563.1 hypothetical protein T265_06207 [Opisthorchis viverrini]